MNVDWLWVVWRTASMPKATSDLLSHKIMRHWSKKKTCVQKSWERANVSTLTKDGAHLQGKEQATFMFSLERMKMWIAEAMPGSCHHVFVGRPVNRASPVKLPPCWGNQGCSAPSGRGRHRSWQWQSTDLIFSAVAVMANSACLSRCSSVWQEHRRSRAVGSLLLQWVCCYMIGQRAHWSVLVCWLQSLLEGRAQTKLNFFFNQYFLFFAGLCRRTMPAMTLRTGSMFVFILLSPLWGLQPSLDFLSAPQKEREEMSFKKPQYHSGHCFICLNLFIFIFIFLSQWIILKLCAIYIVSVLWESSYKRFVLLMLLTINS